MEFRLWFVRGGDGGRRFLCKILSSIKWNFVRGSWWWWWCGGGRRRFFVPTIQYCTVLQYRNFLKILSTIDF